MGHVLTMANLKLKPSLFTPRPNAYLLFLIISEPTPDDLTCPDKTISTDPSRSTATLNLPSDIMPDVQEINGETPRVWRLDSGPAEEFSVGEYEIDYGIIYTSFENGGASVGCTFKINVQGKGQKKFAILNSFIYKYILPPPST